MESLKEVFINDIWQPYEDKYDLSNENLIWRLVQESYYNYKTYCTAYYLGHMCHRIDGPADIAKWFINNEWQTEEAWIVNGIYLFTIFNQSNVVQTIFEAATKSPQLSKSIEIVARYNKLLDEKQLELLDCLNMLK
jgi:hypothetical protein